MEARREGGLIDIVAVYPNSSLACTCAVYVNYGIPSEHIMAVFLEENIYLNMRLNVHDVYHQSHLRHLDDDNISLLTVGRDKAPLNPLAVSPDASWDYCIKKTSDEWELIGLGGEEFSYVAHPVNNARSNRDIITESVKKDWYYIEPLINQNEEARRNWCQFVEMKESAWLKSR